MIANLEAERACLGAMMLNHQARVLGVEMLAPDDFARNEHRDMFRAIGRLQLNGVAADLVTVSEEMRRAGTLERAGGEASVAAVCSSVASVNNIPYYARIVKAHWLRRKLIEVGTEITTKAADPEHDALEVAGRAFDLLTAISSDGDARHDADTRELILKAAAEIREGKGDYTCQSGLPRLDRLIGGFARGELILVAARTSVGKSAFVTDLARRLSPQHRTLYITMEMGPQAIIERAMSGQCGWSTRAMRLGEAGLGAPTACLDSDEMVRALSGIRVVEPRKPTPDSVHSKARAEFTLGGSYSLVVVDHAQEMTDPEVRNSRVQEMGNVARKIRHMAREIGVPVILCWQLHRGEKENERPTLRSLKDSGASEEVADKVIFLHAPYKHKRPDELKPGEEKGKLECIVGKHRAGPTGIVNLKFDPRLSRFEEVGG